jgi:Arc/MetJ family transcription regulator
VAELTESVDLSGWPAGTRLIVRKEEPHPGAQFNLFDPDGYRYQTFICDAADADIAYLEARHRGHARVEERIKDAKDCGLNKFPCYRFAHNQAWLAVVLIACDLLAWTKRLCLDGELAAAAPKRLRYCLLHTAASAVRHARRRLLRLQASGPWTEQLTAAFTQLRARLT